MSLSTKIKGFIGYMNMGKGNYEKAERYLSEAYDKGMTEGTYLMSYGALLMRSHQYSKCKEVYEKAYECCDAKANYMRAIISSIATCNYKLGDMETALKQVGELYEDKNIGSTVYVIYGYLLMKSGKLDDALKINLEGYEYDEEDVSIADNLGQTYLAMGDKENAKKYFEKALDIKGNMPDSCYYVAMMEYENGNLHRAKKLLLQFDDDDEFSALTTVTHEEIRALLEKINAAESADEL